MDRRRRTISSTACCMRARTSWLIAFTTEASCAAPGGYWPTCKGGRNCVCHLDGNGMGINGNVEIGRYGQSEYRVQSRDLIRAKIGKISALPTVTKGMMGAR